VRVCDVSHVGKKIPSLSVRDRGRGAKKGCDESRVGRHRWRSASTFVGVEKRKGTLRNCTGWDALLMRFDV
jgi:hypothetical protein